MPKKREIAGCAIGGIGHNMIYALFSGFLLIFYTDVFRLSPVFTGVLFLIARCLDAVIDPVVGMITDRTKSRFGRYRVWIMRGAPVIAVSLILCFIVPDFPKALQYIYCYVTYILLGISFSFVDVPFWTLPAVMTNDSGARNRIFSIATISCCLASGIGAVIIPIIVSHAGSYAAGYLICAVAFSALAIVTYYTCASLVREHVEPPKSRISLRETLSTVFRNRPLLIVILAGLFGNFAFQMKMAITVYYSTYALGAYAYTTYLSIMLLIGMLAGSAAVPWLVGRLGAKNAMIAVLGAGAVLNGVFFFFGYASLLPALIFMALTSAVVGAFSVLVNSMSADASDYAEYKIGTRNDGVIMSTRTFITKLATALAGAAAAFALSWIGYVPNAGQTAAVKGALQSLMSVWPGLFYVAAVAAMVFYPLGKDQFREMERRLGEKRASRQTSSPRSAGARPADAIPTTGARR